MSLIVYPVGTAPRIFLPRSFTADLLVNQRAFASPYGGSEQVVDLLNDRWAFSMELAARTHAEAAAMDAFIGAMRGMSNTTELYHFGRPTNAGTLAGSPTAQATAQGAASIVLNATTGQTLRAGDHIGVGGMLLRVASDCTAASSAITVPLVNRLRKAVAASAPVTVIRPVATFRLASKPRVVYVPGYTDAVAMDFLEHIAS